MVNEKTKALFYPQGFGLVARLRVMCWLDTYYKFKQQSKQKSGIEVERVEGIHNLPNLCQVKWGYINLDGVSICLSTISCK